MKGSQLKVNSKLIVWDSGTKHYVPATVVKLNPNSLQAQTKEGDRINGVPYDRCWLPKEFEKEFPDEFSQLFPDKAKPVHHTQARKLPESEVGDRTTDYDGHPAIVVQIENGVTLQREGQCLSHYKSWESLKNERIKYNEKCNNSTYAAASEPDSHLLEQNLDSTSSDSQKLTSTAQTSSVNDSQEYPTLETSRQLNLEKAIAFQEFRSVLQPVLPVNPSQFKESDLEQATLETVSPDSSESSQAYNRSILSSKMCPEFYTAHTDQVWGQEPISGTLLGSYTSAGTMQNGKLSPQPTLERPGVDPESLLLEAPTALSSMNSKEGGQSNLEKQLAKLGAIATTEVANPEFLESASRMPVGWTDPADSRSASEFLQGTGPIAPGEKPAETHSTPELPKLDYVESSTLNQLESLIKDGFLPLGAIELLPEMQPRLGINAAAVETYQSMLEYSEPPPLIVFKIKERLILTQGFHRFLAARNAGKEVVRVEVTEGSFAEAQLSAAESNAYNGLQLTPEEKRRSVQMYLNSINDLDPNDPRRDRTVREIAAKLGCSFGLVAKIQRENKFCALCTKFEISVTRFKLKSSGALGTYCAFSNIQMGIQLEWDLGSGRDRFSGWIPLDEVEVTNIPKPEPNAINGFQKSDPELKKEKSDNSDRRDENTSHLEKKFAEYDEGISKIEENGSAAISTDEQYTPKYVWKIGLEMLSIEAYSLDPCTNSIAKPNVPALSLYSKNENGLTVKWDSISVWLNPPYSNPGEWVEKAIAEYEAGNIDHCFILVSSDNSTKWYQKLLAYPGCLVDHRIKFINPDNNSAARFASSLFYLGKKVADFRKHFDVRYNEKGLGTVILASNLDKAIVGIETYTDHFSLEELEKIWDSLCFKFPPDWMGKMLKAEELLAELDRRSKIDSAA